MNIQNEKFEFSFATEKDDKDILELYEALEFEGNISIIYTKRPSPLNSLKKEGHIVFLPIIREKSTNTLVAMASWVIKKAYIGGELKNVAYLGSFKVHKNYRNKIPFLKESYRLLYEKTKDYVDIYYSTILEENILAQKIFEKPRKNMPKYNFVDNYTSFFLKTGKKIKNEDFSLEEGYSKHLTDYYKSNYKDDFSPLLSDYINDIDFRIFLIKNNKGEKIGAFALWNQTSYKQYIVKRYSGLYKVLKYFPTQLFGYPKLPKEKELINCCSLSFVIAKDKKVFEFIIKKACELSVDYDFIMMGLTHSHRYFDIMNTFKSVKYKSKFYTVEYSGKKYERKGNINLEIGLL